MAKETQLREAILQLDAWLEIIEETGDNLTPAQCEQLEREREAARTLAESV